MKLTPELVPQPLWYRNIRKSLGRKKWERLVRNPTLEKHNHECQICGATHEKGMICHEIWKYDDENCISTLTGFTVICPLCNFATHLGLANIIDESGKALAQIAQINAVSLEEAQRLVAKAFDMWEMRSQHEWSIMIDAALINEFPFLEEITL